MKSINIEYKNPEELKPYPGNANTHSTKQIDALKRSIKRFGFIVPVLIDEQGMLICGHGRVEAAKELRVQTIPVICVSHLSKSEKRTFIIADNRIAEDSEWDPKLLAA